MYTYTHLDLIILNDNKINYFPLTKQLSLPSNFTFHSMSSITKCSEQVLKLLKMAKGIRALLDTVIQALSQVGNLDVLRQDDFPQYGENHLITVLAPIYFVIFVLVNVVVAVLMKKLDESNRIMSDDTEINEEIE
ncbi:unnamed protein product [Rotaria sp. Silwood1]|nr:unnamed protein product [Rotaria sp. Silwood1]